MKHLPKLSLGRTPPLRQKVVQISAQPHPSHKSKQLARWQSLIAELADPAVEMTVEEISPLVATFQALRRAGHVFDHALIVLMDKLIIQLNDQRLQDCIEDTARLVMA